eukprot:tig00000630_g2688.t1
MAGPAFAVISAAPLRATGSVDVSSAVAPQRRSVPAELAGTLPRRPLFAGDASVSRGFFGTKLYFLGRSSSTSNAAWAPSSARAQKAAPKESEAEAKTGKAAKGEGLYKDTIKLPVTKFDLRANSVKREPEIQNFWEEKRVFQTVSEGNTGATYVLHDGPPYANGQLHIGHFLNKVLKDMINRYQLLKGRKVQFVPGWDCHGLPIELKVLQAMTSEQRQGLTSVKLRRKARDFALKTVEQQRKDFRRYGVWADWEAPYLTLQPEYEAAQLEVFGKMVLKGHIYRGKKPVHWSPSSKTALAEAELEYPEGHTSRSIYVGFDVTELSEAAKPALAPFKDLKVGIWTTTPWTIPANLAVAVNPELPYAVVEAEGRGHIVVAKGLVDALQATLKLKMKVVAEVAGKDLEHCKYKHPLYDRVSSVVIGGDYITTESGTGLVHTAPGHGQEDYITGLKYGLPLLSPVDDEGRFTEEAGEAFKGLDVLSDGNQAVIDALQGALRFSVTAAWSSAAGALLKEEAYVHKYPYDWRTKKPTIFRATEQWFASVEGFRQEALQAIRDVEWIPASGENRITAMTEMRSDWCISRQRTWGVPIPVFYDEDSNEALLNEETISHVKSIIEKHPRGSDAWWEMSVEELLPEKYAKDGKKYRKGTDTMDVWFDSGSSWAAVVRGRKLTGQDNESLDRADLYLEGSDQHRGWFQSSLLTSVASRGVAPYKTVLTHGFVLDENGRKMSKSLGNTVDPAEVIEGGKNQKENPGYGADVLRLWAASVDYSSDVLIGKNIIKQMSEVYRKIRGTARFLLGSLSDFDPKKDAVPYKDLPELDKYILHRAVQVFDEVDEAYTTYEFSRFFQAVQRFCVVDLSNFYLDVAKDRLYISATDDLRRRSCQTVLAYLVENLARSIAPVLPHMAEDIWQYIPYETGCESVFQSGWLTTPSEYVKPELESLWLELQQLRRNVNLTLEKARVAKMIGSSLDAKILIKLGDNEVGEAIKTFAQRAPNGVDELRYLTLTSQVELVSSDAELASAEHKAEFEDGLAVAVLAADGGRCDRCWNYSTRVGESAEHPLLCERCLHAV